jgi:hypothetical protein
MEQRFFLLSFFTFFFRLFIFLLSPFNFTLLSCLHSLLHSSLVSLFPHSSSSPPWSSSLYSVSPFSLSLCPVGVRRRYPPLLLSVCLCVLIFTGRRLLPGSADSGFAAGLHARQGPPYAGRHYATRLRLFMLQPEERYAAPSVGVVSLVGSAVRSQSPLRHGAVRSAVLAAVRGSCPVTG